MREPERDRAIVVGASSGIGAALARALARVGYDVALVARRGERLAELCKEIEDATPGARARAYVHDVRDIDAVGDLFDRIVEDLRGLDLLIYAAGVMPEIGPDDYETELDGVVVVTNLLGAIAWGNEAARWLATAGSGHIVGISSLAGERGRRGYPAYGASKAGLNTYLESLRNRLAPHGVHVLTVKPGFVRTAMLEGRSGLFWVTSAEDAAEQIVRALRRRRHTVFVSPRWRAIAWVVRALPSFIFRRLSF
jgi:decaprenylphospho-beta-D-erythro-pentofuranosid-2-ulose 2-reductase